MIRLSAFRSWTSVPASSPWLTGIMCVACIAMTGLASVASAQVDPNLDNGVHAFGSYDTTDMDSVSLTNGALTVEIPLFSLPQRGNLKLSATLRLGSKRWMVRDFCDTVQATCKAQWDPSGNSPFSGPDFGMYLAIDQGIPRSQGNSRRGPSFATFFWTATDPDGATHQLVQINGTTARSVDGSGILCTYCTATSNDSAPASGALYASSGTNINGQGQITDSNGNYMSTTDSLNRLNSFGSTASTTDYSGCGGSLVIAAATITTFPGVNGMSRMVKLCYGSIHLLTDFQAISYDVYGNGDPVKEYESAASTIIQSASLYNGVSWASSPTWVFEYNDGQSGAGIVNYADLTKITFPAGGSVAYAWGSADFSNGSGLTPVSRYVGSRVVNAGNGSPATPFIYGYGGIFTIVTKGASSTSSGDDTVHTFSALSGGVNEYETQTDYYSGSGSNRSLLKSVSTKYQSQLAVTDFSGNGERVNINVLPRVVTTTLPGGLVSKTEKDYDTGFTSEHDGQISYGKVTQKREYDFGSGAPGALLRCTSYSYKAFQNSAYLALNLLDLPTNVGVYGGTCGGPALVAESIYDYDTQSLGSSGVTTQRNTAIGSARGNQTLVQKLLLNTGGAATTTMSYYDTGLVQQVTDPNLNITSFAYSAAYQGAFPTTRTLPSTAVAHTVSANYDLNSGLVTSFTDENAHTSSYSYDALGRMTNAAFPDGGGAAFTYPTLSTVVESVIGGKQTTSTFDGLGRIYQTRLTSDPQGTDSVDTTYDSFGRVASVSNPYRTTSDPTYGMTVFTYDALNRMTVEEYPGGAIQHWCYEGMATNGQTNCNAHLASNGVGDWVDIADESGNDWQQTIDGLGRLKSVIEPSGGQSGTGTVPTMETDYSYDALNNLTGVTQWGGARGSSGARSRSYSYDSLSRLIQAFNPESGWLCYGTTGGTAANGSNCTEGYDADSNLQSKTDARGITISYSYDALNRLTSKRYSNDTSKTPTTCIQYDTSAANGAGGNLIGRLTNEWTAAAGSSCVAPPSGSYYALRSILSYDAMGRITNEQQCTPNKCTSGSGPAVSYGYDLAGNPTGLTNSVGAVNGSGQTMPLALTTGFDAAGHMNSVTSDWNVYPTNIFTLNNYGPVGPIHWSLGPVSPSPTLTVTQGYTNRLWINSISATGQVP